MTTQTIYDTDRYLFTTIFYSVFHQHSLAWEFTNSEFARALYIVEQSLTSGNWLSSCVPIYVTKAFIQRHHLYLTFNYFLWNKLFLRFISSSILIVWVWNKQNTGNFKVYIMTALDTTFELVEYTSYHFFLSGRGILFVLLSVL